MEIGFENVELDKAYIKACIQAVLNKCHTHSDKKIMDDRKDSELNFACPICGDSQKRTRLKRGHLFYNTLTYKCYNEGCRSTFTNLCKLAGLTLDPEKKLQLIQHASANMKLQPKEDDFQEIIKTNLISLKKMEDLFNNGTSNFTDFKPIQKGSLAHKYLLNRKIYNHTHIYECNHWVTNKWSEYSIVFLNRRGDSVLGLQTRNLKDQKEKRNFKIYNFKELLQLVEPEREMSEEELEYLNKISYFFNILNVNFEETVTLFEGYTDSVFYPNSIGMVGLNTNYNFLLENNLDIQFFFDNDDTGKRKTLFNLESGLKCFLWKKLFEDIAKKQGSPDTALHMLESKIKDLNRLAIYFDNPYEKFGLQNYFSKDSFDKIYLNVQRFVKKPFNKDFKNQNHRP